jgi:hypothetical protein
LRGGNWFSGFHQLIVQPCLVDDLARMPNEFPDPAKDHRLLCVVLPDLFALLTQFLNHGCHLCVQVRVLRLDLVELLLRLVQFLPVRPLRQLPEDVSGSAVIQRLVAPPGDVLQLVILGLDILQLVVDSGKSQADRSTFRHVVSRLGPASGGGGGGELGLRELGGGLPSEDGGASGIMGSLDVLESATVGRIL